MPEESQPESRRSFDEFATHISHALEGHNRLLHEHAEKAKEQIGGVKTQLEKQGEVLSELARDQIRTSTHLQTSMDDVKEQITGLSRTVTKHGESIAALQRAEESTVRQNSEQYQMISGLEKRLAKGPEVVASATGEENKFNDASVIRMVQGSVPLQMATAIVMVALVIGFFKAIGADPSESAGHLLNDTLRSDPAKLP
jgi:uncharacterized protein YacL (UPF0231 family)